MINPSSIDLNSLPWLPLDEKTAFPKRSAIYFAIDSLGNVQYIGRAKNVHSRWGSHHRYNQLSKIGGVRIAYLEVSDTSLLQAVEKALIEYFHPRLNRSPIIPQSSRCRLTTTYRLDSWVTDQLVDLSDQAGESVNSYVEKILFEHCNSKLPEDKREQPLGDQRRRASKRGLKIVQSQNEEQEND